MGDMMNNVELANECDELIDALGEDHAFVCDKLANGDRNADTNSGAAAKMIERLTALVADLEEKLSMAEGEIEEQSATIAAMEKEGAEETFVMRHAVERFLASQGCGYTGWIADAELRELRDAIH